MASEASKTGENISREWEQDSSAPALWDALQLIKTDPAAGLQFLAKLAEGGSSLAMLYLGNVYSKGQYGILQNGALGEQWLRCSAKAGSFEGAFQLAYHLLNCGRSDEAIAEFIRLGKLNYAPAFHAVGKIYLAGKTVPKNIEKALYFFKIAEKQKHLYSSYWISYILMKERKNPILWVQGLWKKIYFTIPFVKLSMKYPNSDRLR